MMHIIKLQVNESIYSQVLSFINQFQTNELSLIEDKKEDDYVVSSVEEVQKRVFQVEQNANYVSVDTFFSDMDKKICFLTLLLCVDLPSILKMRIIEI
ncbi:hypothetical protein JHD48_02635 [Sulfurimonas sp. SAG-AH-194-I05]|nr:hypothetical protein [Sulfurimonas sp. SAG-AH-194-I05]MDF1874627.1 hypothetical protein [Sulfurimonas sp. SAG-AH-194-I05]